MTRSEIARSSTDALVEREAYLQDMISAANGGRAPEISETDVETAWEEIDQIRDQLDRRDPDLNDPSSGLVDWDEQDARAAAEERIARHLSER